MPKKTVSFSLEDDILKIIDDYKKAKNLSSRSTALERLLLQRESSINKDYIREAVYEILAENNIKNYMKTKEENDIIEERTMDMISCSYDEMPD